MQNEAKVKLGDFADAVSSALRRNAARRGGNIKQSQMPK
jgi:hypothetical protein